MPTLYIVIGDAKPKLKEGDKSITIDLNKFNFSDIQDLLKIASLLGQDPEQKEKEIDSATKKVLGMDPSELMKFDQIKLCMKKPFLNIVKSAVSKKNKLGYDILGCGEED